MKKRAISFICGLGLLLAFATVVSWARSNVNTEGLTIGHQYSRYTLAASDGALVFQRGRVEFDSPTVETAWREAIDPDHTYDWGKLRVSWSRDFGQLAGPSDSYLGFGFESSRADQSRRIWMPGIQWNRVKVQVPHWFLVIFFGFAPGIWMYRRSRLHAERVNKSLCRRCGFDLGNTYHSCPACGERAPLPEGFPVFDPL